MAGYLFKQGIKGLTRNQWRKRYFKFEKDGRLSYYKAKADTTPKGWVCGCTVQRLKYALLLKRAWNLH